MNLEGKTLKVCSCNRTVALDAKALAAALKASARSPMASEAARGMVLPPTTRSRIRSGSVAPTASRKAE